MSENKLEFIIKKDVEGADLTMDQMSVSAAKAFNVLLNAIIKISGSGNAAPNTRIQIQRGSAKVAAVAAEEEIERISAQLSDVVNFRSNDKNLVKEWRAVQRLFHANGLEYDAVIHLRGQRTSVFDSITSSDTLKIRVEDSAVQLAFLKGILIEVGGKSPNIHVDVDGESSIIACTVSSATKSNKFLYKTIRMCAWEQYRNGTRCLNYCDAYEDEDEFRLFEETYNNIINETSIISSLKKLHYAGKRFLDEENHKYARKLFRLFTHESVDVNYLKTILMLTSSLRDFPEIKGIREKIQILFDELIEKY